MRRVPKHPGIHQSKISDGNLDGMDSDVASLVIGFLKNAPSSWLASFPGAHIDTAKNTENLRSKMVVHFFLGR